MPTSATAKGRKTASPKLKTAIFKPPLIFETGGGGADAPSAPAQPFDRSQLQIDRALIEDIVGGFSDLYNPIGLGYDIGQPISAASIYNLYDELIQIEDKEQRSVELVRAIRMQESVATELYEKTILATQITDKARTSTSSG